MQTRSNISISSNSNSNSNINNSSSSQDDSNGDIDIFTNFTSAANQLTLLYKNSLQIKKQSYLKGYKDSLDNILEFIESNNIDSISLLLEHINKEKLNLPPDKIDNNIDNSKQQQQQSSKENQRNNNSNQEIKKETVINNNPFEKSNSSSLNPFSISPTSQHIQQHQPQPQASIVNIEQQNLINNKKRFLSNNGDNYIYNRSANNVFKFDQYQPQQPQQSQQQTQQQTLCSHSNNQHPHTASVNNSFGQYLNNHSNNQNNNNNSPFDIIFPNTIAQSDITHDFIGSSQFFKKYKYSPSSDHFMDPN